MSHTAEVVVATPLCHDPGCQRAHQLVSMGSGRRIAAGTELCESGGFVQIHGDQWISSELTAYVEHEQQLN